MADLGESWIKKVLIEQKYRIIDVANVDCLAIKDNIALIIEEKDNKCPLRIGKTKAYTFAGNKRFPFKLKQMNEHLFNVLEDLKRRNYFLILIEVYVISNMLGRYVNILRQYKSHIFFVNKGYFPVWLKHLEYVYLGTAEPFPNLYMGGKITSQ